LLRKQVTEKLFYNRYSYKLVCRNDLANEFRNNRLHHVGKLLDSLQLSYESNLPLQLERYRIIQVGIPSFEDAKLIYNELKNKKDYRLRISFKELTIYSNKKEWLYNLGSKMRQGLEWWEPQSELTPLTPGFTYLKRPIPYEYRLYIKGRLSDEAVTWLLTNNNDKVKLGPTLIDYLQEGNKIRLDDFYFYVKSDRVLTILRLLMPGSIRSINKVVCMNKNA
jgi:hypothetical protein